MIHPPSLRSVAHPAYVILNTHLAIKKFEGEGSHGFAVVTSAPGMKAFRLTHNAVAHGKRCRVSGGHGEPG